MLQWNWAQKVSSCRRKKVERFLCWNSGVVLLKERAIWDTCGSHLLRCKFSLVRFNADHRSERGRDCESSGSCETQCVWEREGLINPLCPGGRLRWMLEECALNEDGQQRSVHGTQRYRFSMTIAMAPITAILRVTGGQDDWCPLGTTGVGVHWSVTARNHLCKRHFSTLTGAAGTALY